MQQRLPRWPRLFAAQRPAREVGPPAVPVDDDPWAGEDDDWASDDVAAEAPGDFTGFFRGLVWGLLVGVTFWALAIAALVFLFA